MTPHRRRVALVGLAALAAGCLAGIGPAAAHSGGQAQLFLADLRLQPLDPAGWTVLAALTDLDSGKPLPGFDVQITGLSVSGNRFGPVPLHDPEARGRYSATITPEPGPWSITVDAKEFPGGAEAIPFRQTADVQLTPGVGADAHLSAPRRSGSSEGKPLLWAVPTVLAVGWLVVVTNRRRSLGVPG